MTLHFLSCISLCVAVASAVTCMDIKSAYKTAGCCKDKSAPVSLEDGFRRPGCNSKVAKNFTEGAIVGGTLYVYDPAGGSKSWKTMPSGKKYVDLAESSIAAGCTPKHKPHMVLPSPDGKHTAVTYTSDQDFAILKNDEKKVIFCPTVDFLKPHVFGGATHTGAWYGTDSFLLLDMTGCVDGVCGGAIHKFSFTFDSSGTMNGTSYVKSLGFNGVAAARGTSSTKPIALGSNPGGAFAAHYFVTDAKGSGSIMDAETMTWVKHFNKTSFGNCSGGGLWTEAHPSDPTILLAQYGKQGDDQTPGASCIFKVDLNASSISLLAQLQNNVDAHGLQFCTKQDGQLTVLNTNRQTATLDVFLYSTGDFLLQGYDLNAKAFDATSTTFKTEGSSTSGEAGKQQKLQPDVVYLYGEYLYMAARGPKPVSAVKAQNFFENAHPGLMALKMNLTTCLPADSQADAFALTTLERSPAITSDVHSAWGVMNGNNQEIWAVDQAGTGSVQAYYVYSACAAYGAEGSAHADP